MVGLSLFGGSPVRSGAVFRSSFVALEIKKGFVGLTSFGGSGLKLFFV